MTPTPFSRPARVYIGAVIALGMAVTAQSAYVVHSAQVPPHWLILAALTLLTGTFTIKVSSVGATISVSEAFVFTAVLLFGPAVATVIVALDCCVMSLWLRSDARSTLRTLFNLSSAALAIWLASHVFYLMGNITPSVGGELDLARLAWPLFTLAALYFLLNSWLVAVALAAERHQNVFTLWRRHFQWLGLNYFGGASVATLFVSYTRSIDFSAVGIILPLLVTSYLTYRTALGRVEDANRHLVQVNELYVSTIETLAMAVDAKDQITHGHIRRVQVYATELARRLGVTDERQLKAIEAAALLHDMGKLAIPEHILNKPGKLSSAEFETMKRHAEIGADLLSSIPFPYPVTPIVRHHHENWDGRGYPNGISGADIPLGARILSVVDCFDALTSDRPYRASLSDDSAFAILKERRGTMYDPLVVDTFIAEYEYIAPSAKKAGQQARSLLSVRVQDESNRTTTNRSIRVAVHNAVLVEARHAFVKTTTIQQAFSVLAELLRDVAPASVVALYTYVPESDVLRCTHAAGDPNRALLGFEIPNGDRTTGWVAANGCGILNSPAALDLGGVQECFSPTLETSMSIPLQGPVQLLGVLTLYSFWQDTFNDHHRHVAEQIAMLFSDRWHILNNLAEPGSDMPRLRSA
jgi:putative nucleotidyltransferase with HDIG domain